MSPFFPFSTEILTFILHLFYIQHVYFTLVLHLFYICFAGYFVSLFVGFVLHPLSDSFVFTNLIISSSKTPAKTPGIYLYTNIISNSIQILSGSEWNGWNIIAR